MLSLAVAPAALEEAVAHPLAEAVPPAVAALVEAELKSILMTLRKICLYGANHIAVLPKVLADIFRMTLFGNYRMAKLST